MAAEAIDSYKLLTTLKATGKDANYSAEELAHAFRVAQEGADLLTTTQFESRMGVVDARFRAIDARFDAIDTRFDAIDTRFDALESKFEARFGEVDSKFGSLESKFDSKFDFLRADIKAEVKASQLQNLLWLSGIILASNGAVIALLARVTHLL
jgi:hypothetical protein